MNKKSKSSISTESYLKAIAIIFALMIFVYLLTFILPGGEYARIVTQNGSSFIDTSKPFTYVEGGLPFWKWILAPILVLGSDTGKTLFIVIAFLLIIGGVFRSFRICGLNEYMLNKIVNKYGNDKYKLMIILVLFFMSIGSLAGTFEAVIPITPIVVSLSLALGWNSVLGLAISLLAVECGFAVGVANPFTIGIAQTIAGLPMFSGIWLRIVSFGLIFTLLILFLRYSARHCENNIEYNTTKTFELHPEMDKAIKCFAIVLGVGIVSILVSSFVSALRSYSMIIVVLMFFIAGLFSVKIAKMSNKDLIRTFIDGLISMAPCIIMILMASSIKYILTEAHILDTILYIFVGLADKIPNSLIILFIYLLCLFMNFFIPSGPAKAFLLIPLIVPLAQLFGIPAQLCILAYAFGDGFSNVIYPTNPGLLISLGLTHIDYVDWIKFSWKFQIMNFILTSLILLFGLAVGYC